MLASDGRTGGRERTGSAGRGRSAADGLAVPAEREIGAYEKSVVARIAVRDEIARAAVVGGVTAALAAEGEARRDAHAVGIQYRDRDAGEEQ